MMSGLVDSLVEGVGDILSAAYSRAISASRALICDATLKGICEWLKAHKQSGSIKIKAKNKPGLGVYVKVLG